MANHQAITTKSLILIVFISFLASLANLFNVLIWAFQVPPGKIFLWVSHYFPDYFAYIQVMTQGARGHWLVENPYTTDEVTYTFLGWGPDLILGKLGHLFGLSMPLTYWLAVGLFSLVLAFLIFYTIFSLLPESPFYLGISAFLLTLFSGPFLEIKWGKLIPFDYWYAPTSILRRFGPIPRHLLDQILALLVILLLSKTITQLEKLSIRRILARSLFVALLLCLLFFFSFLSVILSLIIFIVGTFYLFRALRLHQATFWRLLLLFSSLALATTPVALFVKHLSDQPGPLARTAAWDVSQQAQFAPAFILLITGPLLLFCPFGLVNFIKKLSPLRLIFLVLLALSLIILYTPIAPYLGTASIRLFSPLNWIAFGVLAISGIQFLSQRLSPYLFFAKPKLLILLATLLLLLYAVPAHLFFVQSRITEDKKSLYFFNYFPQEIYQSLNYLNLDPTPGAVLTRPEGSLGLVVPLFTTRKAYLARPAFTVDLDQKWQQTLKFYQHQITDQDACDFLAQNGISFVVWTVWDGTADPVPHYRCLTQVFRNSQSLVLKFNPK